MWFVDFNHFINEYLNFIFVINDTLVYKFNLNQKKKKVYKFNLVKVIYYSIAGTSNIIYIFKLKKLLTQIIECH